MLTDPPQSGSAYAEASKIRTSMLEEVISLVGA